MESKVKAGGLLVLFCVLSGSQSSCPGGNPEVVTLPQKITQMVLCVDVKGDPRSETILDAIDITAGVKEDCDGRTYPDQRLFTNLSSGRGCTLYSLGTEPPPGKSGFPAIPLEKFLSYEDYIAKHYGLTPRTQTVYNIPFNTHYFYSDLLGTSHASIQCLKPTSLVGQLSAKNDSHGSRSSSRVTGRWDGYDYDAKSETLYVYALFDFSQPEPSPGDIVELKLQNQFKNSISEALAKLNRSTPAQSTQQSGREAAKPKVDSSGSRSSESTAAPAI